MSTQYTQGVMLPMRADVHFDAGSFAIAPVYAAVTRIEQYAGASPGTARVSFPANFADDATRQMHGSARISVGGTTIFRGVIGYAPFSISTDQDEIELVLFDDKWVMQGRKLGMPGIGTQGSPAGAYGFADVGFEITFNKEGKPNKAPDGLDFCTGSSAVYWTLRDCMNFVFLYYVPQDLARITDEAIEHTAYDAEPSNLALSLRTVPQAIEEICQLAGEQWTLIPGSEFSAFRAVRPGVGTVRYARLLQIAGGASARSAGTDFPQEFSGTLSIENSFDRIAAVSSPIIVERTYTTENGLLAKVDGFKDKEYVARYKIDVAQYSANGLGLNLSAGSLPKKLIKGLVTRMNSASTGYLTAAQIAANPALARNQRVKIPVWVALDGVEENAELITGGYRIDTDAGAIDFETVVETTDVDGNKLTTPVAWDSETAPKVAVTLATVLHDKPEMKASAPGDAYLPSPRYEVVNRPDLIPERRYVSKLPNLATTDPNDVVSIAADAEEKYIDVSTKLQQAADNAFALANNIDVQLEARFPFFPLLAVGDRLSVVGRNTGATGEEVIISVFFDVYEKYETQVRAARVMAQVDPRNFVERRRGK